MRGAREIVVALLVVLVCGFGAPGDAETVQERVAVDPVESPPVDAQVQQIRTFLAEHETSIAASAGSLRSSMGYPPASPLAESGGCDGPVLEAERAKPAAAITPVDGQMLADAVTELLADGPPDLARAVLDLQAGGGRVRLDTDGLLDREMIALRVGNDLVVGDAWVNAAIQNPASIHGSLAHEIAGHIGYGVSMSCVILETALAGTPAMYSFDTYRAAYLTYAYPETEIYAELHELPYRSDVAVGDDPHLDIIVMVHRIRDAHPPALAELIIEWIRQRCDTDPTLTAEARFYCQAALGRT